MIQKGMNHPNHYNQTLYDIAYSQREENIRNEKCKNILQFQFL